MKFIDNGIYRSIFYSFLERIHGNVIHMGKLADIQTLKHGIPPIETNLRKDNCGLSPRDELLQTVAMSLLSYHLQPEANIPSSKTPASSSTVNITENSTNATTVSLTSSSSTSSSSSSTAVPTVTSTIGSNSMTTSSKTGVNSTGKSSKSLSSSSKSKTPDSDTDQEMHQSSTLKTAKVSDARSKWSLQEISKFEEGIVLYGENRPLNIANHMGTRTSEQVRERIKTIKRKLGLAKGGPKRKNKSTGGAPDGGGGGNDTTTDNNNDE